MAGKQRSVFIRFNMVDEAEDFDKVLDEIGDRYGL